MTLIEWKFTPQDVANVRFAVSPLWELVASLVVLRKPGHHPLHQPWVRQARQRVAGLDLAELYALVPVGGFIADFLTPPPTTPLQDIDAELEIVRRTPAARVAADVAEVSGVPEPTLARIAGEPGAAARRLADAMASYWDAALRPHWPRIRALLDADILWRSRCLATGGARALFAHLHDSVSWDGDRLRVADRHHHAVDLAGEGLVLVPSVMCWPAVRKMVAPYQPAMVYPVRGVATVWERTPVAPDALAALLGRTRALMLLALGEPASTTALARRLGLSSGAVSQHLAVLRDNGLVVRSRVGRCVLYRRTVSGDMLITSGAGDAG